VLQTAYNQAGYVLLTGNILALTVAASGIPVLIGMFAGAPLLAREYEAGTFRFSWTQATSRTRWAAAKLALLGAALAAAASAFGALVSWWLRSWISGPHGQVPSFSAVDRVLSLRPSAANASLASQHLTLWTSYQPPRRFWVLQSIEGGAGLLLALLLGAATV
jgi:hypothetical protein